MPRTRAAMAFPLLLLTLPCPEPTGTPQLGQGDPTFSPSSCMPQLVQYTTRWLGVMPGAWGDASSVG
ncbi:MAG: hypothetical protein AB8C95_00560 [Phycisphaeraceae bacterium]